MSAMIRQKPVALLLTLIVTVFFLSTPLLVTGHNHFSDHDHSASHATLECLWTCAASSFAAQEIFLSPDVSLPVFFGGTRSEIFYSQNLTSIAQPRAPPLI